MPLREWLMISAAVLLPLFWLPIEPFAAIAVTAAGVTIVALARRVASMPALLLGKDFAAEKFVDDRLRAFRVFDLLLYAAAMVPLFIIFTNYRLHPELRLAALLLSYVPSYFLIWRLWRARRPPPEAELTNWYSAAS
jgi:hypothetical protein